MSKIIAIYSSEADLTNTLDTLYAQDIESDDVRLVRDNNTDVANSGMVIPIGAGATNNAPTNTPNPAATTVAIGSITDMGLGTEERRFYEQQLEDGASLLFIDVDDDKNIDNIKQALSSASRVDVVD